MIRMMTALLFAACIIVAPLRAASSTRLDHVMLDVALEHSAQPGETIWLAIRQTIDPGWHTYWRNPGDSGLPTTLTWDLPKGVLAGKPLWPLPERLKTGPIVNFGYRNEATLLVPLHIAPGAALAPAHVGVFLLECADMCIPEQAKLDIDWRRAVPALFPVARAALPKPLDGTANYSVTDASLTLTLTSPVIGKAHSLEFFPATANAVDYDTAPQIDISGNTLTWHVSRARFAKRFHALEGVLDVDGTYGYAISAMPAPVEPSGTVVNLALAQALLFAFLGGLILNLMPCVLPILSMKALALSGVAGDAAAARRDGLFYGIGVLAAFAGIGGALALLKAGGAALGWGFQLQSPLVVFALVLLMGAIGLNLLGAFELPLGFAGVGDTLTRTKDGRGAFFTGVLAVLVASPCTAPFMGSALGFALTQPSYVAFLVFLALGFGFALPFATLAYTPALVRLVPKPGLWMIRFKQFLAFPMFASGVWLLWVLAHQVGADGLAVALSVVLGIVFLLWLLPFMPRWPRRAATIFGFIVLALAATRVQAVTATAQDWGPWSPEAVAAARAAGKPVLVDFSAAWCVTCLVNERIALHNTAVEARLKQDGIVTLKADWTNHDATIAAALNRHGRDGVPLYLLYPSDPASSAIVLPQILTPSTLLTVLRGIERK